MATYQIHRLRNHLRQQFRFAPHVSGVTNVKPRDYEAAGTVDAASPYAAFFAMRDRPDALEVGDMLELDGALRILKFVGFEEAQWVVPEAKLPLSGIPDMEPPSAAIQ
ncbi:MAG: hypothetical protein ABIR70_07900 [Bryobacteraceae bacterium]